MGRRKRKEPTRITNCNLESSSSSSVDQTSVNFNTDKRQCVTKVNSSDQNSAFNSMNNSMQYTPKDSTPGMVYHSSLLPILQPPPQHTFQDFQPSMSSPNLETKFKELCQK